MPIPDLGDTALFPSFLGLPEAGSEDPGGPGGPGGPGNDCCLLAQVKDDMTITKPTLVLADRDGHPFALVFDGFDRDGLDLAGRGLKKGATVVVPGARRTTPAAAAAESAASAASAPSRRPLLRVARDRVDTVRAVAAPLAVVLATAAWLRARAGQRRQCAACGAGPAADAPATTPLRKCTGCGAAWYCDQACQTAHWTGGHKTACRAVRGIVAVWGDEGVGPGSVA